MTAGDAVLVATRPGRRSRRRTGGRQPVGPWGWIVLVVLFAFALGPIVIFAFDSLKTQSQLAENPLGVPTTPQWHNFVDAWVQAGMGAGFLNSLVLVAGTVLGVLVISGFAAYAMARLDLKGGQAVITYLLISGSLPMQMFLVPLFYLWTRAGLYDTLLGVIVIYCAIFAPFATLLLRSFLIGLPRELEEAARLDGAGELRIAARVILPNALPGVLTVALITALSAYNEFLFAVTFLQTNEKLPVATTFFSFQQGYTTNGVLTAAAGLIMLLPMLILFLLLQRRFVDGLANTGMSA